MLVYPLPGIILMTRQYQTKLKNMATLYITLIVRLIKCCVNLFIYSTIYFFYKLCICCINMCTFIHELSETTDLCFTSSLYT